MIADVWRSVMYYKRQCDFYVLYYDKLHLCYTVRFDFVSVADVTIVIF